MQQLEEQCQEQRFTSSGGLVSQMLCCKIQGAYASG